MNVLRELRREKDFFIGIDSDGCVFDSMELKHKECFCPNFIRVFELQGIQKYARETWDFVNLYSKFRGVNRFIAVREAFRLLELHPGVMDRGVDLPDTSPLEEWIGKESKLGNPALQKYLEGSGSDFLKTCLKWSLGVNASVEEMVYGITPYPVVLESLKALSELADVVVVSQTPGEALQREWEENKIDKYVRFIAGQEYGTKAEHLALAAKGKYPDENILMIGDAPGDYQAAQSNRVLFYPIVPGLEEDSWKLFHGEAMDRFYEGSYVGEYENKLIREFNRHLPEKAPWEK